MLCGKEAAQAQAEDKKLLHTLSSLTAKENSTVAVKARQIMIQATMPSFKRRCLDMEIFIQSAVENLGSSHANNLQDLVDENGAVFDVLTAFFDHKNTMIQQAGTSSFSLSLSACVSVSVTVSVQRWRCTCGVRTEPMRCRT